MYIWEEGPYVDDLHIWEENVEKEYQEFLKNSCRCAEECECISFDEFKDKSIEDVADRYEGEQEERYGEVYAW